MDPDVFREAFQWPAAENGLDPAFARDKRTSSDGALYFARRAAGLSGDSIAFRTAQHGNASFRNQW